MIIFLSILLALVIISYGWMFDFFFGEGHVDGGLGLFGRVLAWLVSPLWATIFVIERITFWWIDRKFDE